MPNPELAQLIGARLRTGLVHPGDPERDLESRQIALPFGKTAGMPEEMVNLVNATTDMLAEAIIFLIETDGGCQLIPNDEATAMRRAVKAQPEPEQLPVYCRCDTALADPLVILRAPQGDRIVIDGGALIRGLAEREAACPHRRVT